MQSIASSLVVLAVKFSNIDSRINRRTLVDRTWDGIRGYSEQLQFAPPFDKYSPEVCLPSLHISFCDMSPRDNQLSLAISRSFDSVTISVVTK